MHLEGRPHKARADQIRTVTKERLMDRVGTLGPGDIKEVERALRNQLDLS